MSTVLPGNARNARTRPRAPAVLASVAALATLACVSTPTPDPLDPVGCWYFVWGAGADALDLPWGVQLLDEDLAGWPAIAQRGDVNVALTLTPNGTEDHPFGYWLADGDTIELGYPAGGGIVVRVAPTEMTMTGIGRSVGDVIRPGETPRRQHEVQLTRAQCPD